MSGMTDYTAKHFLDWVVGKTAMPSLPTAYIALFTAVGVDAGTGFTEVTGGGYARVATAGADWNAAAASAPSSNSNANAVTFPTATADWTSAGAAPVIAFGIYDAPTGGNLLFWDYLGNYPWLPFTCSSATPGVLTLPAHGFANGNSVIVSAEFGGTLPATGGSWSGLKTVANSTTDTFTAGVNTTGTGDGMLRKVDAQLIPAGVQASFSGGTPGLIVLVAG